MKIPCFVISYNRPTFLKKCVEALLVDERLRVIVVDNASEQYDMVSMLMQMYPAIEFVRTEKNFGHTVIWSQEFERSFKMRVPTDQPYIVTDCDIVVQKRMPWLDILLDGMNRPTLAKYNKFGLGLNTSRIPSWYPQRKQVIHHETEVIYRKRIQDHRFIEMPVDTTLALYRGGYTKYSIWGNDSPIQYTGECLSLRTEAPYEATHLTWHMTKEELAGDEHRNYCKTIRPNSTHWSK